MYSLWYVLHLEDSGNRAKVKSWLAILSACTQLRRTDWLKVGFIYQKHSMCTIPLISNFLIFKSSHHSFDANLLLCMLNILGTKNLLLGGLFYKSKSTSAPSTETTSTFSSAVTCLKKITKMFGGFKTIHFVRVSVILSFISTWFKVKEKTEEDAAGHLNLPALPSKTGADEALQPGEPLLGHPPALLQADSLAYKSFAAVFHCCHLRTKISYWIYKEACMGACDP